MAVVTLQQFQAIADTEAADSDAVSVRNIRDTADNINNLVHHVIHHPIISDGFIPPIGTPDTTTNDVMLYLGYHHVPAVYSAVRWWINTKRTAGTGSCRWTLYAGTYIYRGDEADVGTSLTDYYYSDTLDTASGSNILATGTMDIATRPPGGHLYFLLAVENDIASGDATTRASISTIAVQPIV